MSPQHYNYWKEFGLNGYGPWNGVLTNHSVETNMCGNSGRQSPIDIRETPNSKCYETHQVRSRVSLECLFGEGESESCPELTPFLSFFLIVW